MSKIIGYEITEGKVYEKKDKDGNKTGETAKINNATIYVAVQLPGSEEKVTRVGYKVKEYNVQLSSLENIFKHEIKVPTEYLYKCLNRECIIESNARVYRDQFSGEEMVSCYFIDELVANYKK